MLVVMHGYAHQSGHHVGARLDERLETGCNLPHRIVANHCALLVILIVVGDYLESGAVFQLNGMGVLPEGVEDVVMAPQPSHLV